MVFIAQFESSIVGSHNTVTTDVFYISDKLYCFNRKSNGDFELKIITNNAYFEVTGEFDDFVKTGELRSNDCNLLDIWRAKKVQKHHLMPARYYSDIIQVYEWETVKYKNKIQEIEIGLDKFKKSILEL